MLRRKKIVAVALSALMFVSALSLLAACGENSDPVAQGSQYVASATGATIVFDNYEKGYIAEKDTKYTLQLKEGVMANVTATAFTSTPKYADGYSEKGKAVITRNLSSVDVEKIAHWDKDSMTLTARSEGTVVLTLTSSNEKVLETVYVDVAPAYVENPNNQYSMTSKDIEQKGALMGGTHDPSLIEVTEEDGQKAYYIFSTGWDNGNEIRKSYDLIHWAYQGKSTKTSQSDLEPVFKWLYNGDTSLKNKSSWWAPDIVPAYGGGYWLYTCVVDGTDDGVALNVYGTEERYSTATIMLFHSDTLEPESFTFEGILMQSVIPKNGGLIDVNSIDPQIIYTPEGRMYMAYGSFGTGNYILELNPKTGLRKDKFYKDGKFLDYKKVRAYSDEAIALYGSYENTDEDEDGERIGWSTEYYGKNISRSAMEAPVIARHDNVNIYDDNGNVTETVPTYYYSMHSFDALAADYSMWGGRTENVEGIYRSVKNEFVWNEGTGSNFRKGNQYMSAFTWKDWTDGERTDGEVVEYNLNIRLPGHNDLFTTDEGKNIAAYITRTNSYQDWLPNHKTIDFMVQMHQYYLNSKGDICINANRYGGETNRSVSEEELLAFTRNNAFKMVCLNGKGGSNVSNGSSSVKLNADHTVSGDYTGTWKMFGDNYIKVVLDGGDTYYGVVTPSWLDDQDCFGFTITSMGQNKGYAMFMNAVSKQK